MKSKSKALVLVATIVCVVCMGCNYGDEMRKAFRSAFGSDYNEYQFVSYPTDNFGVGTTYIGSSDPQNFQCATWSCFGYTADQVKALALANPEKVQNIDGHADVGHGGALTLTSETTKSVGIGAVVPSIYNMLDVKADADWSKHVKVTLSMPGGHIRFINADSFTKYMNSLPDSNPRKAALRRGDLIVIWSDLVADSLTVSIDVDTTADADLDAKLSSALTGKVGTIIGQDADLTFKVNAASAGHYELQTLFPVVAAVLAAKPPINHNFAVTAHIAAPNFKNWQRVEIPKETLQSAPGK